MSGSVKEISKRNIVTLGDRVQHTETHIQLLTRRIEMLQEQIDHLNDAVRIIAKHTEREDRPF